MCFVYKSIISIHIFNIVKFSFGKSAPRDVTSVSQTVTPTLSTSLTKVGEYKVKENSFNQGQDLQS